MELHHLRYFVAVARHGSFTKAAEENHVAQPSLSQQIRRLEQELGAPLFDRSGGQVRLTDAGDALLPRAETVLKQVDDARAAVYEVLGLRSGRLVVGTLPWTGSRVLPAVVAEFRRLYPDVKITLHEESTARLTTLALQGETDLTLTTLPVAGDELAVMPLLSESILLAVPPEHQLAGQERARLRDVAAEPFILHKPGYGLRDLCLDACHEAGFTPSVAYESTNTETIQSLVSVGLGVALVPRMAADRSREPAPAFMELHDPPLSRTLGLAWRKDRYLSVAARAFLDVAQEVWAEGM